MLRDMKYEHTFAAELAQFEKPNWDPLIDLVGPHLVRWFMWMSEFEVDGVRAHAYKQGAAVYDAVGATVSYPTPPYPSTHNLGTNRMSEKPRDGVVNKFGQSHDVKNLFVSDGSQFTTGAACNPTLTIVALAIRQADYMAGAMQKKEI